MDRRKGKNGERQADFIEVEAWRQTAEFICKYFTIEIKGELRIEGYIDKENIRRKSSRVVTDDVGFGGNAPKTKSDVPNETLPAPPPWPDESDMPDYAQSKMDGCEFNVPPDEL